MRLVTKFRTSVMAVIIGTIILLLVVCPTLSASLRNNSSTEIVNSTHLIRTFKNQKYLGSTMENQFMTVIKDNAILLSFTILTISGALLFVLCYSCAKKMEKKKKLGK